MIQAPYLIFDEVLNDDDDDVERRRRKGKNILLTKIVDTKIYK